MSRRKYKITDEVLAVIIREWEAAPGNGKAAVLTRHAETIGCSTDTIYRRIRKLKGNSKSVTTQAEPTYPTYVFDLCEEVIRRGEALNPDARRISARRIREKLARRGVPAEHVPSASTINRVMRERGLAAPRRRRRVEAEFALQRVMMDFSRSEYFQLKGRKGDDWELVVDGGSLAYKDDNRALRSWLVSAVDDYSRLGFAQMYPAAGESVHLGLWFLRDYFEGDDLADDPVRHFRHVPHLLQTDYGAFQTGRAAHAALVQAGIPFRGASKESQGKVENRFRHMWRDFELCLAEDLGRGHRILLSDFNALLRDWCVREGQARPCPVRPRLTREQAYVESLRHYPPRVLEDADLLRLAYKAEERTVTAYGTVSLEGVEYHVPRTVRTADGEPVSVPPKTVLVVMPSMAGEVRAVLRDKHCRPFLLEPYEVPAYGSFEHGPTAHRADDVDRRVDVRQSGAEMVGDRTPDAAPEPDAPLAAPSNVKPLFGAPPPAEVVRPVGPMAAPLETGPQRLTPFQARVHVGTLLEPHGLVYTDYAWAFDKLCDGAEDAPGALREELDQAVQFLLTTLRQQAV